jgi:hypothetical protein
MCSICLLEHFGAYLESLLLENLLLAGEVLENLTVNYCNYRAQSLQVFSSETIRKTSTLAVKRDPSVSLGRGVEVDVMQRRK